MRKLAILMCVLAVSVLAQAPPFVPLPGQQPSYSPWAPLPQHTDPSGAMNAASAAYRAGLESRSRAEELKIQQGWLDLARQQAQAQQQAQGKSPIAGQPSGDITQALLLAHMAHPDFEVFVPFMQIVAGALRPDWSKLSMSEYLECLYVIVKHSSFAAEMRDAVANRAPAPPPK